MEPTVVAVLTPPGVGAIATLGLHGPGAWKAVRATFTPLRGELPEQPKDVSPGQFWLGRLGDELRDEAVLTLRQAEPVPWVELHCHGGRQMLAVLMEAFEKRGLVRCSWQQWLHRTEGSALRAEIAIALAQARTPRTAAILLDQYAGAFEQALAKILDALARDPADARGLLQPLLRLAKLGRHLTAPWKVVVGGAANVGKSSLVNALAGYRRSVVSATPGTTRDVVTTEIALEGWPVELADTAGLRDSVAGLETQGMERARAAFRQADLCLWVADASLPPTWPENQDALPTTLMVINKIDLPAAWNLDAVPGAVRVSATARIGLDELGQRIARLLVPEPPAPGAPVPFNARWSERLLQAEQALAAGDVPAVRNLLDPSEFA